MKSTSKLIKIVLDEEAEMLDIDKFSLSLAVKERYWEVAGKGRN